MVNESGTESVGILSKQRGRGLLATSQNEVAISSASSDLFLNSPSWEILDSGSDFERPETALTFCHHLFAFWVRVLRMLLS